MSTVMHSGYMEFVPDPPKARRRERIVLIRDLTGAQCQRCGVPWPKEHRPYCLYSWRDKESRS
jgi:hypothetical protein